MKVFKSTKAISVITWLSLVLFVLGFYGLKITSDKAPVPDAGFFDFIVNFRHLLAFGGAALFFVSMVAGNIALNGRFAWADFVPYLFILPAIALLVIFVMYPMINLIYLSMFKGSILRPTKSFVGLQNYKDIFTDVSFLAAVKNTSIYTLFIVIFEISMAVLLALWYFRNNNLNKISQIAVFLPHLIASISVGFIWGWMMDFHSYGVLNTILGWFNIEPVSWLESSKTALGCIIFVNVWKSMGYYSILVLSSMKSISPEYYEAAELDGSTKFRTFWKITLPILTPQLFFLLITITIGSFKVFDTVNVMTDGGPGRSTEVLTRIIYDYAIQKTNMIGLSASISVVFVFLLCILSYLYFHFLEKKVYYQ